MYLITFISISLYSINQKIFNPVRYLYHKLTLGINLGIQKLQLNPFELKFYKFNELDISIARIPTKKEVKKIDIRYWNRSSKHKED